MAFFRRPIRIRSTDDPKRFAVSVAGPFREVLVDILQQMDQLLEEEPHHPMLRRLRPPAYLDDPERQAAYELLAGEELRTSQRAAIATTVTGLASREATEDDLWIWMRATNSVRLMLGTVLDVGEEEDLGDLPEDDPHAPTQLAYRLLNVLLYELLEALDR